MEKIRNPKTFDVGNNEQLYAVFVVVEVVKVTKNSFNFKKIKFCIVKQKDALIFIIFFFEKFQVKITRIFYLNIIKI